MPKMPSQNRRIGVLTFLTVGNPRRGILPPARAVKGLKTNGSAGSLWRSNPWLSTCLVSCAGVILLAGCNESNVYVPPPPPKVIVAKPLQQPVTRYLELTGNTQAINSVDLEARVQGFLEQINYKDGELVKKGTPLFAIQRNTYEAQLAQSKAALDSAKARQINSETEYTRQVTLGKDQFASQAHVDDAKTKLDQANADVASAEASLQIATINLGYTTVSAPFDGIVTRHLVDVGALVGYAGPTKLASIVQVDPIYVYFNVSETVVLRIKEALAREGKTLTELHQVPVEIGLQTEDGFSHEGRLDYVSPQVNTATGTLEVRAVLDNKALALIPGLFVRVRVPLQQINNALLVADTAIGTSQLGEYVLVIGKDNLVEQRQVKTGQLSGQLRVIESGLGPDNRVITNGIKSAVPGSKVEPDEQRMTASAEEK